MTSAIVAIVLWCAPIDSPFCIILREKYGPVIEVTDATCVIKKDESYYVLRKGRLSGNYPVSNYSIERK